METGTTATEARITRFLGLQVIYALDDDPDGARGTVHYEGNGTCGVVTNADRDPRALAAHCVATLRDAADDIERKAADGSLWRAVAPTS